MKHVRKLSSNEAKIAVGAFRSGWYAACVTIAGRVADKDTARQLREMAANPPAVEVGGPGDKHPEGNEIVYRDTVPAPSEHGGGDKCRECGGEPHAADDDCAGQAPKGER